MKNNKNDRLNSNNMIKRKNGITTSIKKNRTNRLCIFVILLLIGLSLKAQVNPIKEYVITFKNANLKEIVSSIEQQTTYSFIFGEDIKLSKNISLQLREKNIDKLLDALFKDQPISYQINGKHIILKKKIIRRAPRRYTISGYLTDKSSQETLIGANIFENNHREGTTTNAYGFYSITLPEGKSNLAFSYIGYESANKELELRKDTLINIELKSNTLLQEVVIESTRQETGLKSTQMGAMDIPIEHIKNTPTLLGEADVMKTLQLMPGVQAGAEGSAGLYIRGGSPDQNLILLDGVPVYNVDHLFGFFSVFTAEAVKKVSLFKSSFPARFGGRLSSVIDIRTNDGDMNRYHGCLSIGLLSSKLNIEGPIIKNKTSFNISARRSYQDILAKPFMPQNRELGYYFYDINAKINHRFSDKSRLFISFYKGNDHFNFEMKKKDSGYYLSDLQTLSRNSTALHWGNTIAAIRWNYIFNNKLFSNSTVSYNKYQLKLRNFNIDQSHENNVMKATRYDSKYQSGIKDLAYNLDFDYRPIPSHHIRFGTNYLYHQFSPEVMTHAFEDNNNGTINKELYASQSNPNIFAHEISAYLEDDYSVTDKFSINAGVNLSSFFVQQKSYYAIQPRLSARYELSRDLSLKGSYSRTCQYTHLLTSSSLSLPTDLWVPITKNIKPMTANQYCLGTYYEGLKDWEFSVETYYKKMNNVLDYKDGANFVGISTGWEDNVAMGKGRSYGIEFLAQKTAGKSTGWIAYTLSKSDRIFPGKGINNGIRFPYKYDRRHNINLVFNHKFSDRIDICSSWTYYSGGTATIAEEDFAVIRPYNTINTTYSSTSHSFVSSESYVSKKCNYRLPETHYLNIGINFHKKTKHGMRTWNISIYNVYNRMNPTLIYKDYKATEINGKVVDKPYINKITVLPCIPSITYTYKF